MPRPFGERQKRTAFPKRPELRDTVCADIDRIMMSKDKPKKYEEFLFCLEELDYEIKRGKNVSHRGKNQKRFIRLSSLPDNYQKDRIREVLGGTATHTAVYSKKFLEANREAITLHKAAKKAFDELSVKNLPKIKDLSAEYAQVHADKKMYAEYRQIGDKTQELLIAQRNIAALYADENAKKISQENRQKTDDYYRIVVHLAAIRCLFLDKVV